MPRGRSEDRNIRRMADLLRQGAALTEMACPSCASPILRLKNGDLWCATCEKKVIVVKEGEDESKIKGSFALDSTEATLLLKVQEIQKKMEKEEDPERLAKLVATLSGLLENIEHLRKVRKS